MSPPSGAPEPIFFASPEEFRSWLDEHHESATELWVGFHKRATGKPSLTWPQSVDEALCFGWIDGIRKRVDDERYTIRFTPRQRTSTWSRVNIERIGELTSAGRVRPSGLAAFEKRSGDRSGIYSYEQRHSASLDPKLERKLRSARAAWTDFSGRPPWYRRAVLHWVTSAKREETRERRLATLIECSAAGRPIPGLERTAPKKPRRAS